MSSDGRIKALHLNTFARQGGAARAAFRLHSALRDHGVDSWMEVQQAKKNYPYVISPETPLQKLIAKIRPHLTRPVLRLQRTKNPIFHSLNLLPSGKVKRINNSGFDVLHLHWINKEMLSVAEIGRFKLPIVWTLHDGWPFCGAEHHTRIEGRERYRIGYTSGNRDFDHEGIDIDRWVWRRKCRHWRSQEFVLVAPSQWMAKCARQSVLFSDSSVKVIPNAVDTDKYKPLDPCFSRKALNLPQKANLILFGALGLRNSPLKGLKLLREALGLLKNRLDVELVAVGETDNTKNWKLPFKTHNLGRLNDATTLALAYSAANLVVVPSKIESFGLMAAESLACGTPCVGFAATGLQDVVDHKRNGFLATPYNPGSLAEGVQWVLGRESGKLKQSARSKAENSFSKEIVAQSSKNLYQDILCSV